MTSTTGTLERDAPDEALDAPMRMLLSVLGVGLLAGGVIATFVNAEGIATAALLTAGFALLFVGYLGRFVTHIRFREFEAELDGLRRKVRETADSLADLEAAARRYESIRAVMHSGGLRDDELDRLLAQAVESARAAKPSAAYLKQLMESPAEGARVEALAVMKAHPDLRDPELLLQAIEKFRKPYDHDRFLLLAGEMWHTLTPEHRKRLVELIRRQRDKGDIKDEYVRWASSERIIRLMEKRHHNAH